MTAHAGEIAVTRYTLASSNPMRGSIRPSMFGEFVRYDSYAALAAKLEEAEALLDAIYKNWSDQEDDFTYHDTMTKLMVTYRAGKGQT